jgi:hypothetical protein
MTKQPSEHALAILKAGLNAVPVVGGPLASLVGDYIPTATQRNVGKAIADLQAQLESLGERVDIEAVNRDEFAELFKSAYLIIIRSHSEARLRAATRLVSNILLREGDEEKLSYTELDHFARCLDQLSVGAIQVLAQAVSIAERQAPGFLDLKSVPIVFEQLQLELPSLSTSLLMGLIGELDSFNLIHRAGVPGVRTPDYGNYSLEVTPLGARFAKHLLAVA